MKRRGLFHGNGILWWIAVPVALGAHVAGFFLFRASSMPAVAARDVSPAAAFVAITPTDELETSELVRERATLFDPTPLFLPTDRNVGSRPPPMDLERLPVDIFTPFQPKFHFPEADGVIWSGPRLELPRKPAELLAREPPSSYGFSAGEREPAIALATRSAHMEVVSLAGGAIVWKGDLSGPEPAAGGRAWRPLEFMAAADEAGLISPPWLTASSGVEQVDLFFRRFLTAEFRLGQRLEPGLYKIIVGP